MITFVPFASTHAQRVWAWKTDPRVSPHLPQEHVTREQIERFAYPEHDAIRHFMLETEDATPVGYVMLSTDKDEARALRWGSFEIVIDPEQQGQGYGRQALMMIPAKLAAWRGIEVLMFAVFADNTRAITLYSDLGYKEIEQRWQWKGNQRRRVVLMSNRPRLFKRRPIGFST